MDPKSSGNDYLERFRGAFSAGFTGALNIQVASASASEVQLRMRVGPEHFQPHGLVHGGVFAGLVETAGSIGGNLLVEPGWMVVGVENQTSFLRPVSEGTLLATARPLHVGKRSQLWETRIEDERNRLVATGRLRLFVVEANG